MRGSLFSEEECKTLLRAYTLVPLAKCYSLNFDTSLSVFIKTNAEHLLESAESGEAMGRYSFIGKGIYRKFILHQSSIEDIDRHGVITSQENLSNPLEYVRHAMKQYAPPKDEVYRFPPFWGGLLGYLGYETVGYFENIEQLYNKPGLNIPEGILLIPEFLLVIDHLKRVVWIVGLLEKREDYGAVLAAIEKIRVLINTPLPSNLTYIIDMDSIHTAPQLDELDTPLTWAAPLEKDEYMKKVHYCKECIYRGDVIQVVFSRQIHTSFSKDKELSLYIYLRNVNPSPYMFFLRFEEFTIVGSSPETMVSLSTDKTMVVKPIAGTIKRGATYSEDLMLKQSLISDEKEKAEHIMLVDLGRNDLHRIAKPGTVHVSKHMSIDGYSHVYHIVSKVEGTIEDGKDGFDLIQATFPAGTLSGAPKIEAMNIIGRTEQSARNVYGGMVMVMGFDGYLDSCIAIRTAVLKDNKIYLQAGGGIVADSIPEKEWTETELKLGALVEAVRAVVAAPSHTKDISENE